MTAWKIFHVIFRLTTPMHIGCGKSGNLQRTYQFVTGRVFWGALTARITRNNPEAMQQHGHQAYQMFGNQVHQDMAYTYFYPAVENCNGFEVQWPWAPGFNTRHIRTFASTALSYPEQHAQEATLHETEYLSSVTCDTGKQVYLRGYVFMKKSSALQWQKALERLQFGGERSYGWGNVELKKCDELEKNAELFEGLARFINHDIPLIELPELSEGRILAHTKAENVPAHGQTEPLAGREWRSDSDDQSQHAAGQNISVNAFCFTPGSKVTSLPYRFKIGAHGMWISQEGSP